ncbi:MAG TPA: peptidylprolyl isomerase [Gemmataceae bacterium]|nr:peptidylprolyl isomerase [Gemmataceae bacterium]
MRCPVRPWLAVALFGAACAPALAQTSPPASAPPPAQTKPPAPPPKPAGVAATVNGQPIAEAAVQRGLRRVPPALHAEKRGEILNYLIDNALIDQHLQQLNIAVEKKEIDERFNQARAEIVKQGQTLERILQELWLTEDELRGQIASDLRWDKFLAKQATEANLKALFEGNKDQFDGSMVHARHILLMPKPGDAQAAAQAKADLAKIKADIEKQVADGLAKLPPQQDNLAREQARCRLIEDAFAAAARKSSACPSKEKGGDVGWFTRAGQMVEPFSKAAFALKPYQMSDVVQTPFGFHLILTTEVRPGKPTRFEDVKDEVKEVYGDRLREQLCAKLRQSAKIAVNPPPRQ